MLATLVDKPFDDEDWLFEIKWDGYRAIGSAINGKTDLYSRNNISFKGKYPPVSEALKEFDRNVVVDGEIVSLDEQGFSRFQYLQNWGKDQQGNLAYYVFDLLWVDGYDLTSLPLVDRKQILVQIIPENNVIRYSDHIEGNGKNFFEIAKKQGLEGIIAKNKNSSYEFDSRSKNWLKIKTTAQQEAIICGFTAPRHGRQYFGALVLGVYENGKLVYAGQAGSGFTQKTLKETWDKLQPLITDTNPFSIKPKTNMPATWVKPKLICEVKFQEWTQDRIMRVPIFMGLRIDKRITEVKKEKEMATQNVKKTNVKRAAPSASQPRPKETSTIKKQPADKTNDRPIKKKGTTSAIKIKTEKDWLSKDEENKIVSLNGYELKLTNLDKVYWKKENYTKRDLLNYYYGIAPYMLPYMKNRPQSLNRHPNGINGMSFYQKNVEGKVPGWAETFEEFSESTNETVHYFVCTNEASLVYMANLGCIEMNPWHSTTKNPDNPDYCLIDLDPHEIGFDKVIETAQAVKRVLDQLKIPSWCKTSGATGLHICIPLGAKYNYDQSRQLAELLVNIVHHEIPAITSVERSPSKRRRKVYLDFLQNRKGQTIACVYSVRPKPGATVSTPLFWEEVKKGLTPQNFTIKNLFGRLKTEGDIFKPVYEKGIDLKKTLATIERILQ
jgi:bifunctional non-homologous end joining protein LigD